jgi:predicted TIM-barrel fold metal-dependent hydrolase
LLIIDNHLHIGKGPVKTKDMLGYMSKAGISKTVMLSQEPDTGYMQRAALRSFNDDRLDNLIEWTKKSDRLIPVHYLNVIEEDAREQVEKAIEANVKGFKVICANHYPDDPRAMRIYEYIAQLGYPILFHSGILWDLDDNSKYSRPVNFEALLYIPRLKFALSHVGWPWYDELIAVFGKFLSMEKHSRFTGQKMYIDLTPGTPFIYRAEVMSKLLTVGYEGIEKRMLFGTDLFTDELDYAAAKKMIDHDISIYDSLDIDKKIIADVFCGNIEDFWDLR